MPKLLTFLSVVGTAAMLWVGGHILLVGFDELGWTTPPHWRVPAVELAWQAEPPAAEADVRHAGGEA